MAYTRQECRTRLQATIRSGRPIVGAGAGADISAKSAEAGGADLIVIYNSGRFRMAGRGSLAGLMPYGERAKLPHRRTLRWGLPGQPGRAWATTSRPT